MAKHINYPEKGVIQHYEIANYNNGVYNTIMNSI